MNGTGDTAPGGAAAHPLVVPDVNIVGVPLSLSLWLVPEGSEVIEGDRVVELLGGGVTIDLEAPVTGRRMRILIDGDDRVAPGTVIAEFLASVDHD